MLAALIILSSLLASSSAIINGTIPRRFQYPFVVSLQWDGKHKCGGALLDANTILSVAHCYPLVWVDPRQPHRVTALLGTRNQQARGEWPSKRVGIRRIIWPRQWPQRYKVWEEVLKSTWDEGQYDYMLLKTNHSISPTVAISYVSLEFDVAGNSLPNVGDRCFAIGWGRYKFPDSNNKTANDFPQYLRQGLVEIINGSYCWENLPLNAALICAKQVILDGDPKGIPCFGDSGGPLVCSNKDETQYLAGLAKSAVLPCNYKDEPFEFMRISYFRQWIERYRLK